LSRTPGVQFPGDSIKEKKDESTKNFSTDVVAFYISMSDDGRRYTYADQYTNVCSGPCACHHAGRSACLYTDHNSCLRVCADEYSHSHDYQYTDHDGHRSAANRHSNPDGHRDSDGHSRVADCAFTDANVYTSAKTYVDSDRYAAHYLYCVYAYAHDLSHTHDRACY